MYSVFCSMPRWFKGNVSLPLLAFHDTYEIAFLACSGCWETDRNTETPFFLAMIKPIIIFSISL